MESASTASTTVPRVYRLMQPAGNVVPQPFRPTPATVASVQVRDHFLGSAGGDTEHLLYSVDVVVSYEVLIVTGGSTPRRNRVLVTLHMTNPFLEYQHVGLSSV